jgi:hypothetical protein
MPEPRIRRRRHLRGWIRRGNHVFVLIEDPDHGVVAHRVRPWDRIAVRLSASTLDRALAAGTPPESSSSLALRSAQLVDPRTKTRLARTCEAIVLQAQQPRRGSALTVPLDWPTVRRNTPDLLAIAARLAKPAPTSPCGVARIHLLITDGAGPLYYPRHAGDLHRAISAAIEALAD